MFLVMTLAKSLDRWGLATVVRATRMGLHALIVGGGCSLSSWKRIVQASEGARPVTMLSFTNGIAELLAAADHLVRLFRTILRVKRSRGDLLRCACQGKRQRRSGRTVFM
jgi:hypothetical protein